MDLCVWEEACLSKVEITRNSNHQHFTAALGRHSDQTFLSATALEATVPITEGKASSFSAPAKTSLVSPRAGKATSY